MSCCSLKYVVSVKINTKKKKNHHCSTERHCWICKLFLLIGWKLVTNDDGESVTYGTNRTSEEELFTNIFHACDTKCRGKLKINSSDDCSVHQVVGTFYCERKANGFMWCSVGLCLHTWCVQPNMGVRMAVEVVVIS